jgi:DNA repair photolyase
MSHLPKTFYFQTSLETVRAHHWRSYADSYHGCAFECQYCLYKGPGSYGGRVLPTKERVNASADLGILDIGTTTDPYQPAEREHRVTRGVLETALECSIPLFILTRGTMVTRDLDILSDLAGAGLVEVCFSVITLNENATAIIEPGAPPPSARIAAAERLRAANIPVSFHVAPLIPGLDSSAGLTALGKHLAGVCASHVFVAMLGARKGFWDTFQNVMRRAAPHCHDIDAFTSAYPQEFVLTRGGADTCDLDTALRFLGPLRDGVTAAGATLHSENYPFMTTAALQGDIYRWKLPTSFDMAAWIREQDDPVPWDRFADWHASFGPSEQLVEVIRGGWDSGELFLGTYLARHERDGRLAYGRGDALLDAAQHTMVAKRLAAA